MNIPLLSCVPSLCLSLSSQVEREAVSFLHETVKLCLLSLSISAVSICFAMQHDRDSIIRLIVSWVVVVLLLLLLTVVTRRKAKLISFNTAA